jgi:hypothetical protein
LCGSGSINPFSRCYNFDRAIFFGLFLYMLISYWFRNYMFLRENKRLNPFSKICTTAATGLYFTFSLIIMTTSFFHILFNHAVYPLNLAHPHCWYNQSSRGRASGTRRFWRNWSTSVRPLTLLNFGFFL